MSADLDAALAAEGQRRVWIVAQIKSFDPLVWELGGVFSTQEKAVAHCSRRYDAVWSTEIDRAYGHRSMDPPDCVYPLLEGQVSGSRWRRWIKRLREGG